ncbi:Cobalt-zinc-cadmium resistance protein CzcD [Botrimarina colliarenosi]|uniref:Cobalt-zinc-cadmium resistance protein CzcD n=1 Tax=Botrimarina colliarenosi TaxID=2528001 RepID=A0A5C6A0V0_9BACT|nr:cation diffusion facilitator family transporter [Botrimarina colliarenosi]TWT92871.1 Cobalt-zinc-cadmium resistance protein CzcD [Botrimarina colliarenosi]
MTACHDLHIWAISTRETALTAHLVRPVVENDDGLLRLIQEQLHDRFAIEHTTIQIEREPQHCRQASDDFV